MIPCTRRWLVALFLILVLPATVFAQEGQALITSPRANAVIQGMVSVEGVASHPDFWKYEVWIAPGLNPRDDQWSVIYLQENRPVPSEGQLAIWNTQAFPDGVYSLRLRVVRHDANYQEVVLSPINIANAGPLPTGTPSESPTPEGSPTPLPTLIPSEPALPPTPDLTALSASPTVVTIEQPVTLATSTPAPLAARTTADAGGTPQLPAGLDFQLGIDSGSLFSGCLVGMGLTLLIFVVIGLLGLIRQIIRWMF
ncbi:MAG: hypothetical protein M5U01_25400 [Ardenticatenaceae bacterium]|nr:hypothetical protein [Ardenticatenaceae bacterium]HBY95653.1 hypothetical protein [Chloroflexota bacterium]